MNGLDEAGPRCGAGFSARAARLQPASYDDEARTIDVVWTTGAVVRRRDWMGDFDEELSLEPGAVRLERLNAGAAVLNSHWASDARDVVGAVVPGSAVIENGVGRARVQLSGARDVASIVERVREGTLRHVSVGYAVHAFEESQRQGDVPLVRVTDWEPMEVSLVAIPADAGAAVRAATFARSEPKRAASDAVSQSMEGEMDETEDRGQTAVQETPPDLQAVRAEATQAERRRQREIRRAAQAAGLGDEFAERLIDGDVSLDAARGQIIDEMARRAPRIDATHRVDVGSSAGDTAELRRAMGTALAHRFGVRSVDLDERAREFRGLSLLQMAAECLETGGVSTRRMTPDAIARRAMDGVGDFPSLLADVAHNVVLDAFQAAPGIYRQIARRRDFSDFKPHNFSLPTTFPAFEQLADDQADIKFGKLTDSKEQIALVTRARRIGLTRQALVNDDLDAFGDLARQIGRVAANIENAAVVGILEANPTMADGSALFHAANHGNLTSSGTVVSVGSLGIGRTMMRKQTDVNGVKLNLSPRYLVTSPDHETLAEQHTAQIAPTVATDDNPFRGRLVALSDANLTGNPWYLLADPLDAPVVVYGYLRGQDLPLVTQHEQSAFDGLVWKVTHDFGAGVVDYRGGYRNAGAAS